MKAIKKSEGNARVLAGGLHSLIVSYPGRIGYWRVGIPPSGPMDDYSFRIANKIVGNSKTNNFDNAAGLEITYKGPKLQFNENTTIALTGAKIKNANINDSYDISNEWYKPIEIQKGDILDLSDTNISFNGCRTYMSIANGGFLANDYLGSKTSFEMGKFGGINNDGSVLQMHDFLEYNTDCSSHSSSISDVSDWFEDIPNCNKTDYMNTFLMNAMYNDNEWQIGVLQGPQSSPDYLTENDLNILYNTQYSVSHNASRLGIRLNAIETKNVNNDSNTTKSKFSWARTDGGQGGSHPSNLIDNPYPIGSVNFTGDHPVILTVDGPSLGGFVCPITVPSHELWKVGQLKPGDTLRFKLMDTSAVVCSDKHVHVPHYHNNGDIHFDYNSAVLYEIEEDLCFGKNQAKVQYRLGGDRYLLIDYGNDVIDLNLRVRAHKLEQYILDLKRNGQLNGVIDTIPGVQTLLIEYDPMRLSLSYLMHLLVDVEKNYICDAMNMDLNQITLESRIFYLPFAFNCEWTNEAIAQYMSEVREHAAYLPSNTQFICDNNGLKGGIDELESMIYDMSFMVLGLGDVYLGAPCAIPLDPRHRLNVPKYNPSRNYTPEGAVGIGGQFMCIYPMESPGGYQLIGRTLQIFNKNATNQKPWLLDMFDEIRFYPVSKQDLLKQRSDIENGKFDLNNIARSSEFDLNEYNNKYINDIDVKQETSELIETQKVHQLQQLKYDAQLMQNAHLEIERYDGVLCANILWYQAQIIINGAKYETALFVYIRDNFGHESSVQIQESSIENEFDVTLYGKLYRVKMQEIVEKEKGYLYDVKFVINANLAYTVNDIVFDTDNIEYVSFQSHVIHSNDNDVQLICTQLPGKMVKLYVGIGDQVDVGDVIAVISAMKMEMQIVCDVKGTVVAISNDDILNTNDVIAEIMQ